MYISKEDMIKMQILQKKKHNMRLCVCVSIYVPSSPATIALHCCAACGSRQETYRKKGVEETQKGIHSTQNTSVYLKMAQEMWEGRDMHQYISG
jgi:hypothetical protein